MKLSFFAIACAVVAAATPMVTEQRAIWPGSVAASNAISGEQVVGTTNAERIKLGLGPSPPRRLYDSKVKRMDPHPSAMGNVNKVYYFDSCYSDVYFYTYSDQYASNSNTEATATCAGKAGTRSNFAIGTDGQGTYNCYWRVTMNQGNRESCTSSDFAYFFA